MTRHEPHGLPEKHRLARFYERKHRSLFGKRLRNRKPLCEDMRVQLGRASRFFKRLRDREARMDEYARASRRRFLRPSFSLRAQRFPRYPSRSPQKLGPFRNRRWRGTNEAEGPRCALLIRSASRCIRRGGRFRVRVSVFEPSFAWETDYLQICQNTYL